MYGGHYYENSDKDLDDEGEWVGNLDLFVRLMDPLSIFEVHKADFLATTRVKHKIDTAMMAAAKALPKKNRGMRS
eukprot:scaffold24269_cov40-Attheya_sp.AAC.2